MIRRTWKIEIGFGTAMAQLTVCGSSTNWLGGSIFFGAGPGHKKHEFGRERIGWSFGNTFGNLDLPFNHMLGTVGEWTVQQQSQRWVLPTHDTSTLVAPFLGGVGCCCNQAMYTLYERLGCEWLGSWFSVLGSKGSLRNRQSCKRHEACHSIEKQPQINKWH